MNLDEFKGKFTTFNIKIKEQNPNDDFSINSVEIIDCPIKDVKIKNYFKDGCRVYFELYNSVGENKLASITLELTEDNKRIMSQDIRYFSSDNLTIDHSSQLIRTDDTIVHESFIFTKEVNGIEEKLQIVQQDGKVIFANYDQKQDGNFSSQLESSLFTQPKNVTDFLYSPYFMYTRYIRELSLYPAVKARLKNELNLDINCSEEELKEKIKTKIIDYNTSQNNTFEFIPDFKCDTFTEYTFTNRLDLVLSYLYNENNNLLQHFKGNYIGCIYYLYSPDCIHSDAQIDTSLVVVTEKEKEGHTLRCYTIVDNKGYDIDDIYIIEVAKKGPKYVTTLGEDGKEELVLYNGSSDFKNNPKEKIIAEAKYDEFVKKYLTPFSGIQPVKIEDFTKQGIDR